MRHRHVPGVGACRNLGRLLGESRRASPRVAVGSATADGLPRSDAPTGRVRTLADWGRPVVVERATGLPIAVNVGERCAPNQPGSNMETVHSERGAIRETTRVGDRARSRLAPSPRDENRRSRVHRPPPRRRGRRRSARDLRRDRRSPRNARCRRWRLRVAIREGTRSVGRCLTPACTSVRRVPGAPTEYRLRASCLPGHAGRPNAHSISLCFRSLSSRVARLRPKRRAVSD
jgi:hypothetical protein